MVKVYGTDDCPMTRRTRVHLRKMGVEHEYIDISKNAEACQWVKRHNDGKEKKPTVDIDGTILSEPSNTELDKVLMPAKRTSFTG